MQNNDKKPTQEKPTISHGMVAYALGLKTSLVSSVRNGRRKDHYGIISFVEDLEVLLDEMRERNVKKREEAKKPVGVALVS